MLRCAGPSASAVFHRQDPFVETRLQIIGDALNNCWGDESRGFLGRLGLTEIGDA